MVSSSRPENWDSSTITVHPWTLHASASAAQAAIAGIGDDMTDITHRLNELLVSWTGDSKSAAHEAKAFNDEWNSVVNSLYGTKKNPGILNRLASGLNTAAVTYSQGERAIADSWNRLSDALSGGDKALAALDPEAAAIEGTVQQAEQLGKAPGVQKVRDIAETQSRHKGGVIHSTAVDQDS
jgi:uncharacterized protein YukE